MKVVDKKLLFISSVERDSGSIADFQVNLPSHLVACQPNQRLRMVLNDLVLPYTWFNVQDTNNTFEVMENGPNSGFTVTLTNGSYNALQLRDHLKTVLTLRSMQSGGGYQFDVSFNEIDSKFTFTITNPYSGTNTITCSNNSHKLLGFKKGATNTFSGATLISTHSISTIYTDALLLHSDLLNTNVDKAAGVGDSFHLSNVFAKIPISTSPFNNIIFENQNDDYLINIPDQRLSQLRFWFSTIDHEAITLNDDFSFTLKIEVMEDDEKTMVEQNSGIGELLRLLVLQQHQQIQSSKQTKK